MLAKTRRIRHLHPVISEQLQLDLGMPWNGYSPRSLCRVNVSRTFRAGTGPLKPIVFDDPLQINLFPEEILHHGS